MPITVAISRKIEIHTYKTFLSCGIIYIAQNRSVFLCTAKMTLLFTAAQEFVK